MFIDATQLAQNRAPSDAGSMAFELAIKQQKEFEEALKLAQDRRKAEAAAERAEAEARKTAARLETPGVGDSDAAEADVGKATAEPAGLGSIARGITVDVEV